MGKSKRKDFIDVAKGIAILLTITGHTLTNIGLVNFEDYDYIAKFGENMYDIVDGATLVASEATIDQGCLEASNVNVVSEMVNMITISRAYQAGQKVINAVDNTLDKAVNQVGRVQ